MTVAIEFRSVSKKYLIDNQKPRSLQELFTSGFGLRKPRRGRNEFWVLKDINFAVHKGESVALIGPNGAGKSTILKLICSIIAPNSGSIKIDGRVSSLLELGTGFHPDLSGRENIYLNGSMLGLSQKEIGRKYESIVEFAEMADYIDLPVKHYSSGMYLRLAFAVASHIEPDILLIDEAIAVGDYIFQQRCLKRLAQLRQAGVTMILVSHGHDLIRNNCDRGIWLENGMIQQDGDIERVTELYLTSQYRRHISKHIELPERVSVTEWQNLLAIGQEVKRWGSGEIEFTRVEVLSRDGRPQEVFCVGDSLLVRMHYHAFRPIKDPMIGVAIYRSDGLHINGPNTKQVNYALPEIAGAGYVDYMIEALNLLPGNYEISVAAYDAQGIEAYDHQQRLYKFQVRPGGVKEIYGAFYLPSRWRHVVPQLLVHEKQ